MNQFFITVSNGLLSKEHRERMGSAVWEFMWCLDKITMVTKAGLGIVLGGRPVKLSEVAKVLGVAEDTVSRNLLRLEEQGYIETTRAPYGIVIRVKKAKKRFGKNVESPPRDSTRMSNAITSDINVESLRKNVESNKTYQYDNTELDKGEKISHVEIVQVIDSFKEINPAYKNWYGNKTERKAIVGLIESHTLERVLKVIAILPKSNTMQYVPTIHKPSELENKWSALETALRKKRESQIKSPKVAFS